MTIRITLIVLLVANQPIFSTVANQVVGGAFELFGIGPLSMVDPLQSNAKPANAPMATGYGGVVHCPRLDWVRARKASPSRVARSQFRSLELRARSSAQSRDEAFPETHADIATMLAQLDTNFRRAHGRWSCIELLKI